MSSSTSGSTSSMERGAPLRLAATVVGAVFLLVGILGFVPGITTDYDRLSWAGHGSGALLLGIFQVSILHNLVHLAFGVAGLAAGRRTRPAFVYLLAGGVIYLVLWVYGLVVDKDSGANFVPLNTADDWLHLVLGLGMIAAAFAARAASGAPHGTTSSRPQSDHVA